MKKKSAFRLAFFVFVLLGYVVPMQAQSEKENAPNLRLIAKVEPGRVLLRWAPATPQLWEAANETGYRLERLEIPKTPEAISQTRSLKLTPTPIRPWPAEQWADIVEKDDNAAAGYMVLYAEKPSYPDDIFARLAQENDHLQKRWLLGLIAADQSAVAAEAMGLFFADTNILPNTRYLYRIYLAEPVENLNPDTAVIVVNTSEISPPARPVGVQAESLEKMVLLKWPSDPNYQMFTSFFVEKSDHPEGPWRRLNSAPLMQLKSNDIPEFNEYIKFPDSLGVNYVPFYYRVIGRTPFGEDSPPSEVVTGMGKDRTPPAPPQLLKAAPNETGAVELEWTKNQFEPDFKGYIVGRSATAEGPFTPLHKEILPPVSNRFTDFTPNPRGLNFYQITAVDTAGNISKSFSKYALFVDTFPPAPPKNLRGHIDSSGIVTLYWSPNEEPDLWGYRVYVANAADHRFIQISSEIIQDTTFTDSITLHTLTENIYYRLTAVDRGFGHSDFSEMLTLKRPDIIPPLPGQFTYYKVENQSVYLEWAPGSSEDAIRQRLLRMTADSSVVLGEFDMMQTSFTDSTVENGKHYEYALQTTDDDGLESPLSFPLSIKITDSGAIPPAENLEADFDEENHQVVLNWSYEADYPGLRFVVYRAVEGQGLSSYQSVKGSHRFEDRALRMKGKYTYAIRVFTSDGASPLSLPVSVVVTD
ncbi:MAG: hypothetical protein D6714_16185 [Bacteroidetes bacterium]|nr:MAG: hypothetical protein D6714_16185 [Bacteroidota bacterium]